MAVGTPIGGIRVDLQLNSAAFIRDIAKTNAAIAGSTRQMTQQLNSLQKVSQAVGATFGAWVTVRAARKVINFLDQSIELAAKLQNQLGESARAFELQAASMKNAFSLGLAQGFLGTLQTGGAQARDQMVRLAKAGLIAGQVLKVGFTVIVDVFTILIPEAINVTLTAINKAIEGLNKLLEWGQEFDNLFGLKKDYGQVPLIPMIDVANVQGAAAAFFNLSEAENLAKQAAGLAAEGQNKLSNAVKATTDSIAKQTAASAALQEQQFQHAIKTTKQWLGVADTVGEALGTLFKENKAVQIAQTIINTASAIMNAMATLPFPINWAQSAAAAALGAAQIATIASTSPGSGSKAIKKGGGGGGKSSGGSSAPALAGAASTTTRVPGQAVNITLMGTGGFDREQVRQLIASINQAVGDGAELRVSG